MRWVIGFLLVASVSLAGALVWFLTAQPSGGKAGAAGRDAGAGGDATADAVTADEGSALIRIDDEAFLRLEAELAIASATDVETDGDRLAEAWEWVRDNRPSDRAYNQLEAKMLAVIEGVFDGEERSILWAMNMSLLEVEMIRALDADADGVVTDAEMMAFAGANIHMLSSVDHPYIRSKLDMDRDGELSQRELSKLHDMASMQGAFARVLERAQAEAWDSDLDGALSAAEVAAGNEKALASVQVFEDGHLEVVSDASRVDPGEPQAVMEVLTESFGESTVATVEAQREILAAQAVAQGLLDAMRVDNMDPNAMREQVAAEFPRAPEQAEFDVNHDGLIDGSEAEAFAAAAVEYQRQIAEWSAVQTAMTLRRQFEHATQEHDLNGDGRLSDEEWGVRVDDLLGARQKRLFLRSYDLDASGRVDSTELTRFLDWHKAGSIRADANFDGVVNVLDLQAMMESYTRQ